MKSFKNMFTLVLAGLCICSQQTQTNNATFVPVVHAQHNAEHIHNEIDQIIAEQVKVFAANHNDKKATVALLRTIKEKTSNILQPTPAHMFVDLKNAIKNLNPENILVSIIPVRTILKNISPKSKKLIIDALNKSPYAKYVSLII